MMKADEFSKEYDDSNLWVKQIRIIADKEIVRSRQELAEHPFGILKRAMDSYVRTDEGAGKSKR